PKGNNSDSLVYVTTAVDEHNHELNLGAVAFKEEKKFSDKMIENLQFLTNNCKMGATAQRKYLEAKYSSHLMYSQDLYAAIQNFQPTTKSLSNDAAKISVVKSELRRIGPN